MVCKIISKKDIGKAVVKKIKDKKPKKQIFLNGTSKKVDRPTILGIL